MKKGKRFLENTYRDMKKGKKFLKKGKIIMKKEKIIIEKEKIFFVQVKGEKTKGAPLFAEHPSLFG